MCGARPAVRRGRRAVGPVLGAPAGRADALTRAVPGADSISAFAEDHILVVKAQVLLRACVANFG